MIFRQFFLRKTVSMSLGHPERFVICAKQSNQPCLSYPYHDLILALKI